VLPARLGEVLRPYLLARRERLSASAVLATIVERLLDVMTVVLLLWRLPGFSGNLPQTDRQVLTSMSVRPALTAPRLIRRSVRRWCCMHCRSDRSRCSGLSGWRAMD